MAKNDMKSKKIFSIKFIFDGRDLCNLLIYHEIRIISLILFQLTNLGELDAIYQSRNYCSKLR